MNEERYLYRTFANVPSSTDATPELVTVYDPDRIPAAAKVDKALERLQLHLTYSPYAGWKDTIRQDVETVVEAWREFRRESQA